MLFGVLGLGLRDIHSVCASAGFLAALLPYPIEHPATSHFWVSHPNLPQKTLMATSPQSKIIQDPGATVKDRIRVTCSFREAMLLPSERKSVRDQGRDSYYTCSTTRSAIPPTSERAQMSQRRRTVWTLLQGPVMGRPGQIPAKVRVTRQQSSSSSNSSGPTDSTSDSNS